MATPPSESASVIRLEGSLRSLLENVERLASAVGDLDQWRRDVGEAQAERSWRLTQAEQSVERLWKAVHAIRDDVKAIQLEDRQQHGLQQGISATKVALLVMFGAICTAIGTAIAVISLFSQ